MIVEMERDSFEKTLEELGFLSVNLELELGFSFWGGVVRFFKDGEKVPV